MNRVPAVCLIVLLGLISSCAANVCFLPFGSVDASEHAEAMRAGSDVCEWKRPVFEGDGNDPAEYVSETVPLSVSGEDFEASMKTPTLRQHSKLVDSSAFFLSPTDKYVLEIAEYLGGLTDGCTEYQKTATAACFVSSVIEYADDCCLFGCEEYWAYPLETLYLRQGDCEDTSVLLCSILRAMGIDAVILDFPGHVAVGVNVPGASGTSFEHGGSDYYFLETTVNFRVSDIGFCRTSGVPDIYAESSDAASGIGSFLNSSIVGLRISLHDLLGF